LSQREIGRLDLRLHLLHQQRVMHKVKAQPVPLRRLVTL
jgi:hypothetical protein